MKLPRLKLTIPSGIILLALFFDFFLAISLPYFEFVYVVETSFISNNTKQEVLAIESSQKLTQLSLGTWGACYYFQNDSAKACSKAGPKYSVIITENKSRITVVESSWTDGLIIQVSADVLTAVAFVFAQFFSRYRLVTLITVGSAGGVSLLAFFFEVVFFFLVRGRMQTLEAGATTKLGPGFYLNLFSVLLLGTAFWRLFFSSIAKPKPVESTDSTTSGIPPHQQGPTSPKGPTFNPTGRTFNPPPNVRPLNQVPTNSHSPKASLQPHPSHSPKANLQPHPYYVQQGSPLTTFNVQTTTPQFGQHDPPLTAFNVQTTPQIGQHDPPPYYSK